MANLHLLARKFRISRSPAVGMIRRCDSLPGARSWVCAGSNFLPKEHVALYEACVIEKNFDKGRAIMSAMLPLMDFLECGKFVQSIQHGCEIIGLKAGSVRAPLHPLNSDEKRTLETVVATLKRTVGKITSGRPIVMHEPLSPPGQGDRRRSRFPTNAFIDGTFKPASSERPSRQEPGNRRDTCEGRGVRQHGCRFRCPEGARSLR